MSYSARAATNEAGVNITVVDTISNVSMNATPILNREPRKKEIHECEIGSLRYDDRYSLLAVHVINRYKPFIRKKVKYGRDGAVNWIELDGKTVWERKGFIHDVHKRR